MTFESSLLVGWPCPWNDGDEIRRDGGKRIDGIGSNGERKCGRRKGRRQRLKKEEINNNESSTRFPPNIET